MCTNRQNNILFVAGGTGGHIFPAISVYNLFKNEVEDLFPGCVGQDPNKKVSNLIEEKGDYRKLKLLPNAKLESFALIPKSSHFNVIENPKGCANAVYDFIKNI